MELDVKPCKGVEERGSENSCIVLGMREMWLNTNKLGILIIVMNSVWIENVMCLQERLHRIISWMTGGRRFGRGKVLAFLTYSVPSRLYLGYCVAFRVWHLEMSQKTEITSVGEDVEKLGYLYVVGRSLEGYSYYGKQWPQAVKPKITIGPRYYIPVYVPKRTENRHLYMNVHSSTYIAIYVIKNEETAQL